MNPRAALAVFVALAALASAVPIAPEAPLRATPLPGCETFQENQCQADEIETPEEFNANRWQTPAPTSSHYRDSYQSFHQLVGHAQVVYAPGRRAATVTVVVRQRANATLSFSFDGVAQATPSKEFTDAFDTPLEIVVTDDTGARLELDDVDFIWNAPVVSQGPEYRSGQKGAVVEFFGWPHADIEQECAFLADAGYMGLKLFPNHEQLMADDPYEGELNPWYFMYQPVSYRLQGRMGTRDELRSMIQTCRSLGVRVYADAVINHMVGCGNDANPYHRDGNCNEWGPKSSSAKDPAFFSTQCFGYIPNENTGLPNQQEFPAVPWSPTDFHCERTLSSWTDGFILDAGWLVGLTDLATEKENVQQRIADYLTDLISIGFSGFRIDAAKHIKPDSLVGILAKLKANLGGSFPEDFHTWLEVLIGGEADLLLCNTDSGHNYAEYLENALAGAGFTPAEIDMVKIWFSGYPKEPSVDCGKLSMTRKVIQNDDHDQQSDGSSSRDMGDQGSVLVIEKNPDTHRSFQVKLFTDPNGAQDNDNDYPIRYILSSYYFTDEGVKAIPDGLSDCDLCRGDFCDTCRTVKYSKAYDPDSCGYDDIAYTRVHRDIDIINAMRSWMGLSSNVTTTDLGLAAKCRQN